MQFSGGWEWLVLNTLPFYCLEQHRVVYRLVSRLDVVEDGLLSLQQEDKVVMSMRVRRCERRDAC